MDKYQSFILATLKCYISPEKDYNPKAGIVALTDIINSEDELVVKQVENYNIKKHFVFITGPGVSSIEIDGKACDAIKTEPKDPWANGFVVPVDFDNRADKMTISFVDSLADPATLKIRFEEVNHAIYDSKVQAELNSQIRPEHKTGIDLVNIYWNLVSEDVETTQINLYAASTDGERLISKSKETGQMFKSITGLAFGLYRYEIIELDKNGKEVARTGKIEFRLSAPNYSGRHTVII